jgi:outer membrane protein
MRSILKCAAAALLSCVATGARAETLSPESALSRAARRNPSLRAAVLDLAAARHGADAAVYARDPVLFLGVSGQYNESFSGSSRGVTRNESKTISGNGGVRYTTPIGTALEIGTSNGVSWRTTNIDVSTTDSVTIGPNYTGEIYANGRQPILRGAGTDTVLAPVREAELGEKRAEHERDQAASQIALDVLTAYWELWYAQRALAVQQTSLELAQKQRDEAQLKVDMEVGNTAKVDVLRFATELASIRESVANARATRESRAVELGRLLGMKPKKARTLASRAKSPEPVPLPSLETLIAQAHESSPELHALEAQIESARISADAAEDAALPQLDLIANVAMGGLWTSTTITTLALPGDRPAFTVLLGLEFEVPLGPGQGNALADRAQAELHAAEARYEASVQALDAELASVAIEAESTEQQITLATETASIAKELAQAERDSLELGLTTPLEVVRAQQSEREAELRRLRALVDHVLASLRVEHRSGMLLPRVASNFQLPE